MQHVRHPGLQGDGGEVRKIAPYQGDMRKQCCRGQHQRIGPDKLDGRVSGIRIGKIAQLLLQLLARYRKELVLPGHIAEVATVPGAALGDAQEQVVCVAGGTVGGLDETFQHDGFLLG